MNDQQILIQTKRARQDLHAATGYNAAGGHYRDVDKYLNSVEAEMKRRLAPPAAAWQGIGPVQPGGRSLLDMSLTHASHGLPKNAFGVTLWPAVDTAWGGGGGVVMCAPETMTVDTKDSSASPGEAIYCTGRSGVRYWFAHLDRDHPLGTVFAKGATIGKTLPIPGSSDHGHVGVNVEKILGIGKRLLYGANGTGPDYTLGAPSIRKQLEGR